MTRHLTRIGTLLVVVAALLVVPTVAQVPSGVAQAADARQFDAGNIISDAIFFDGWAMDASSVQRFLDSKGATCVAGEMPCLRNFRQDTATQAADALCNGYQGVRQESAATIIAKVGASCGINPRVLLVLLQKEQSLVTRTKPTTYAYTHATGFACPDTAPCDPAFSGFVSQVYFAARQFERYRVEASRYGYKAGRVNSILWHPNTSCGRSDVFIANQATAGLYNYTPYRPNQSALNAQYGTGDGCSSYGNRNFWLYFTDWFGSTQYPGASNVSAAYEARGGATGPLGSPTSTVVCGLVRSGCYQHYTGGSIFWSPATGAAVVKNAMRDTWAALDWERGALGYPRGDEHCGLAAGGCLQDFEGGAVAWSPATGARAVSGAIAQGWGWTGRESGPLGYPVEEMSCPAGG
ncbi:LGFP repeat-containing protein, partial [Geodermatophilus sp. SYSU D01180]